MPRSTRVDSGNVTLPGNDDQFQAAFNLLKSLSRRQRDAIVNFIFWWFRLTKKERAVLAKIVRPEMTDMAIATLVGVDRTTLTRWPEYKRCRPDKTEHKHIRRKPAKWRRSKDGGRWPLDHPDIG